MPPVNANKWQNLLDQLNSSGSFYRPKEGRTRVRLVLLPETETAEDVAPQFYVEVHTTFRGKAKTKYIIPCLVMEGKGMRPEMATTITPVVVSKVVVKGILGLLAEGYDLFSPEDGFGVTISRTGQGLDTDYSVMPSKSPVPLPDTLEEPEKSLSEMAAEFEAWSNRNANNSSGDFLEDSDEEAAPPPQRRGQQGASRRRRSNADEGEW